MRIFGRLEMPLLLRRVRASRAMLVLAVLVLGGAALIGATGATAGPAFTTTVPFTFNGTNSCVVPPEDFVGSGQMKFLISDNLSTSGNVQYHTEVNLSGLQAVTITGKKYVVIDQENQTDTFDSDGMPAHQTVEHTLQFIRQGEDGTLFPGDDFYEHFLAHTTANANGTVTVDDLSTDTRCQ
jgi:hypothetical protein